MSQMMEARKVQKVGYSTLIVSFPKDWGEQVSLKQGDIVTFRRERDDGITVYPGLPREWENHRAEVLQMEEGVERMSGMILSKLLLAVLQRRVAKEVVINGTIDVMGNTVIAKSMETKGDLATKIAQKAFGLKGEAKSVDTKL